MREDKWAEDLFPLLSHCVINHQWNPSPNLSSYEEGLLLLTSPLFHKTNFLLSLSELFHILFFDSKFSIFLHKTKVLNHFKMQHFNILSYKILDFSHWYISSLYKKKCVSYYSICILHYVVPRYGYPGFLSELLWEGLSVSSIPFSCTSY